MLQQQTRADAIGSIEHGFTPVMLSYGHYVISMAAVWKLLSGALDAGRQV